jgi:nucleotide-binding universal stress UspA family protein
MKLLIAYDGSEGAEESVRGLGRAGLPRDVAAIVLTVADVWPPLPTSSFCAPGVAQDREAPAIVRRARRLAAEAMEEARVVAGRGAASVRAQFPGWEVAAETAYGSPPYELVERAKRSGTELLVVGARAGHPIERLVLGTVSQKVLAYAGCSVQIARAPRRAANSPVRILIGFDGSENARAAVRVVASRAWPAGTSVRVVTAVDLRLATMVPAARVIDLMVNENDETEWVRRSVERAAADLCSAGLTAEPVVREPADAKRLLVEEAEGWGADCIFVGARGHGGWERLLLGSVSAAVAARAHCSVEIVR